MIDVLSLFLIVIFVPVIVIAGIKVYNPNNYKKLLVAFSITILGIELLRFFVNASFYESAIVPSNDLKLSFITFLCVIVFFAIFNKSKFGETCKNIFILTSLNPIIVALFNSKVYLSPFDNYGLIKALYFLQCGFVVLLAILFVVDKKEEIKQLQMLYSIIFVLGYAVVNFMANYFWETDIKFNWLWFLQMSVLIISTILVYLTYYLLRKSCLKNKTNKVKNIDE